jgi:hypothetical protein
MNVQNENFTSIIFIISEVYSGIHGWLSVVICLLGIPFNIFNIVVLNKAKIASFATNSILISIAFCDTLLMITYLPFSIHFYIQNSNSYSSQITAKRDTFFWTHYSLFNIFVSVTFHSITT